MNGDGHELKNPAPHELGKPSELFTLTLTFDPKTLRIEIGGNMPNFSGAHMVLREAAELIRRHMDKLEAAAAPLVERPSFIRPPRL